MADEPIRCDECGFIIGSLTRTAHDSPQMSMTGNDSNCIHPPISRCPSADKARRKALASRRPARREPFDDVQ
jgi:hypothetical protein